jgi:hypothetical protein
VLRSIRKRPVLWICALLVLGPLIAIPLLSFEADPPESFNEILKLPALRSGYQINALRGAKITPPLPKQATEIPAFTYAHFQVDRATAERIRLLLLSDRAAKWRREWRDGIQGEVFTNDDFQVAFVPIEKAIGKGRLRPANVAYELRTNQTRRGPGHELRYLLYDKFGIGGP